MRDQVNSERRLARARAAGRSGSRTPHTVVVLPSYTVADSLLAHYQDRIPALEHRQLLSMLMLPHVPGAEIVFVTSLGPERRVLDYYLSLVPPEHRQDMRARIHVVEVPDSSARSITAKLLDRPDLVVRIRELARDRLAYIEPWNVTPIEMELARRLGMPLNGTTPELWPLGFKSNSRRILRSAGVPVPLGHEDVRSVGGVVAAARAIQRLHPDAAGVVIKSEDSATGDGNRVIRFSEGRTRVGLRAAVESLEAWYLSDIKLGSVVEELVVGDEFASPSVQVDIAPRGRVRVLSTHEQHLDGPNGQVYSGCRFPADPWYASELAAYGQAVGRVLAEKGAMGRFSVDFAAVRSASGDWELYGLEINLRKTGTSHPLTVLQSLAPGRYVARKGRWLTDEDGSERCYRSTDNLVDPSWHRRSAADVIAAVRSAGLEFDRRTQTGVVLHMFCGLDIDGRLGLTAVGTTAGHAEELYQAAVATLSGFGSMRGLTDPSL